MGLNRAGSSNIDKYLSWQHLPSSLDHQSGYIPMVHSIVAKNSTSLISGKNLNFAEEEKKVLNAFISIFLNRYIFNVLCMNTHTYTCSGLYDTHLM